MATQNPIEQEGTYPLPEAQLDRFLMHVEVAYPSAAAELAILNLVRNEGLQSTNSELPGPATITRESIFSARQAILGMHMEHAVEDYVVALVMATRQPPEGLESWIEYGASPRATISLDQCARAHAWLAGRDFVAPQDVAQVAPDVLRHRLILSFDAQAQGVTTHQVIDTLLSAVPTP